MKSRKGLLKQMKSQCYYLHNRFKALKLEEAPVIKDYHYEFDVKTVLESLIELINKELLEQ